ncbi:imm11 family protein [Psychrobacter immobilis]|uniref:imm11 family protein n=1 Tax=Psychrobacter immobilis TaxID=498 RepID=UPI001918CC81|nr:DUF1629 domain-containing protein [Psychrobacter immobilis]
MIEQLYFVKYKSGEKGCPIYIGGKHLKDGEWTGDHEWDYYNPDPFQSEVKSEYTLKMNESFIDLDYSKDFVSEKFLELLDELKIKYRSIRLEIILRANKNPEKKYYILLLVGRVFLLDEGKSKYQIARNLNTQEIIYSKVDSSAPVYSLIDEFYIKDIVTPHFFIAEEMGAVICTANFRNLAKDKNIRGIDFEKVEDGFKYDPWDTPSGIFKI